MCAPAHMYMSIIWYWCFYFYSVDFPYVQLLRQKVHEFKILICIY